MYVRNEGCIEEQKTCPRFLRQQYRSHFIDPHPLCGIGKLIYNCAANKYC